ncbi:DUF4156 domain-containing protein [Exilibacterium tricleocarpae]|uniref:DUF4156 domain-containing protein n=1 Tax=Exilibacterium tricleocarpae TaxID=2591008 RepID=UPI001C554177|nr:DUF4156 domain-containing protein [Exilibacterium tricleocarpae]
MRAFRGFSLRIVASIILVASAGCAWVELTPGARDVAVISAEEAEGCKLVGRTTARSLDKVAFVSRSERKLAVELATLARNDAAEMGGNAVVAQSAIEDGARRFAVYSCP